MLEPGEPENQAPLSVVHSTSVYSLVSHYPTADQMQEGRVSSSPSRRIHKEITSCLHHCWREHRQVTNSGLPSLEQDPSIPTEFCILVLHSLPVFPPTKGPPFCLCHCIFPRSKIDPPNPHLLFTFLFSQLSHHQKLTKTELTRGTQANPVWVLFYSSHCLVFLPFASPSSIHLLNSGIWKEIDEPIIVILPEQLSVFLWVQLFTF